MKYIIISLIRFYQKFISPLTSPKCKYYPTCSCYALTSVKRFGAIRGSALAAWRILRCNPWSMGGIDYVPEKFTFKVKKYDYERDFPSEMQDKTDSHNGEDKN
ncbi:putative membrane protein insertion efficiency factor [Ruminococcus sp. YRD2003]|uniref:membrane protein insertion efficiency factor YidD n=1 Tax=Ruminococcus sp. YRD2003 TaxID=1452313 RepID=UPI0008B9A50D|nr:membrane protein insertion efficiency factor YidD [Ruminococcus sp.]SEL25166.1 putative membrane protein insertion efficiency factor [Ruminococcus flavefaciens]